MSYLDTLLQGVEVEWKTLGEVTNVLRGRRLTREQLSSDKRFPVFHGGLEPLGYYEQKNRPANSVMIINVGASAGTVGYSDVDFWSSDGCYSIEQSEKLNNKFVYYFLIGEQHFLQSRVRKAGIPTLDAPVIEKIPIPIPCADDTEKSLKIQKEIVRILDTFTEHRAELTAELKAELTARKKQYAYYRDKLLSFEDGEVEWKTLGEVALFRRGSFPQPYGNSEWYDGEGAMPFVQVVDVGHDMKLVRDTKNKISKLAQPKSVFVPKDTVIVTLQGSIGRVAITQYDSYVDRTLAIFEQFQIEIDKKYFAYQLQEKFRVEKETARGDIIKTITKEDFKKFQIPIPSLEVQKETVRILNTLTEYTAEISAEISAEFTAREKQYEYYRNLLLTFSNNNLES